MKSIFIFSIAVNHRKYQMRHYGLVLFSFLLLLPEIIYAQRNVEIDLTLDSLLSLPVSTASKYAQTSAETPASITIITSGELQRYNYKTLSDVLNRTRGIYLSNDRNYTYVGVRGFSRPTDYNNRILLLIDGHSINENVYGSAFFGDEFGLTLDAVDRIEIVRGPGSALYGTGAMFGVVNVITKNHRSMDGLNVSGSIGSYGSKEGSFVWSSEINDISTVFFSANYGENDGPDLYFSEYDTDSTNHGVAQHIDWDKHFALSSKISLYDFLLSVTLTSREKGIPTGSFGTIFNHQDARTLDQRRFFELQYNKPLESNMEVSTRLYGDYYYYKGIYPYDILGIDRSTGSWWGAEGRIKLDFASNHRFIIGTEYQHHRRADYMLQYGDSITFDQNIPISLWSLFGQNEYQLSEHLALTGGIRYDRFSNQSGNLSPRIAVNWNAFTDNTIKFLAGRAFRTPNFYEKYYEDLSTGFKKNVNLQSEIITTWEIAVEQRIMESMQASFSVYRYDMENLIDQIDDPTDSLIWFNNQSKTTAQGMECEIQAQPHQSLDIYANVSYQMVKDPSSGKKLTNSPSVLGRFGMSFKATAWITASMEGSYDGERLGVYGNTISSFALMNAVIIVHPVEQQIKIMLGIKNLFDKGYSMPGGFEHVQLMIPQQGRELFCTVKYSM